jgi:hypothetical protein
MHKILEGSSGFSLSQKLNLGLLHKRNLIVTRRRRRTRYSSTASCIAKDFFIFIFLSATIDKILEHHLLRRTERV